MATRSAPGGWPCQQYLDGWANRARTLLDDYERLRAAHKLCKGPDSRRDGFAVLRGYLARCASDPKALTGRDVGKIRMILAGVVTRRGAPGSERA